MAISRHKVLSEMQQQLELASSKCGSLQKQLEIVKDKVRKTSVTSLTQVEILDEKENKIRNGELISGLVKANSNSEYQRSSPPSTASSLDGNDDADVNIIKAFYERLGQMDYSPGHVELSDVTSEGGDYNNDSIWAAEGSSAKTKNGRKNVNAKLKEKKSDKNNGISGNKKKKEGKTISSSPYENQLTKAVRHNSGKIKNARNKQKSTKVKEYSNLTTHKSVSKSSISRISDLDKLKKKKVVTSVKAAKYETVKPQQIKKGTGDSGIQLRKTKSTTMAERKDAFQDTRSLTRLIPDKTSEFKKEVKVDAQPVGKTDTEMKLDSILREATRIERGHKALKDVPPNKISNEKGTSISDLIKIGKPAKSPHTSQAIKPTTQIPVRNKPPPLPLSGPTSKNEVPLRNSIFKAAKTFIEEKAKQQDVKTANEKKKPLLPTFKEETNEKLKNGIAYGSVKGREFPKSEVKKKVNLFEEPRPKLSVENLLRDKLTGKLRDNPTPATRAFSQSTNNDVSPETVLPRISSSVNSVPMAFQCEPYERNADFSPLALNHIKRMRDNLMKFNAIPFIVGRSTSKSYHIGLNIQQTYSLFKQTPSMTALRAAKLADGELFSTQCRAKSARTGTERSFLTMTREICPACEPVPDKTPEQLADPWAVPQDDDKAVIRVCTCMPRKIISFDQVLNQLYFTDMNLVKLHPSFVQSEEDGEEQIRELDKPAVPRSTNAMNYTKLLRSIQNLKEKISGTPD